MTFPIMREPSPCASCGEPPSEWCDECERCACHCSCLTNEEAP